MNALVLVLFPLLSSVVALMLCFLLGSLSVGIAVAALILGWVWSFNWAKVLHSTDSDMTWRWDFSFDNMLVNFLAAFVLLVSVKCFVWLLYPLDHGIWTLSQTNLGDLPMHVQYIKILSRGLEFPPINPIFAQDAFRYAFGPDLYNALFEILGVRTSGHLLLTGVMTTIAALLALRRWAGWWGIGGFFLSGGLAHWPVFGSSIVEGEQAWRNLFEAVFLTQRGFIFVLPIALFIIYRFKQELVSQLPQPKVIWRLGFLLGLSTFFHLHTFVAVGLLLFLMIVIYRPQLLGVWLSLGVGTVLSSAYFIIHSTDGFSKASVVRFRPDWTYKAGGLGWYYLSNFGPWIIFVGALLFLSYRNRNRTEENTKDWRMILATFATFIFFLNYIFAPWEWDNIKVLVWPYLLLLYYAHLKISPRLRTEWQWFVALALLFSGFQRLQLLYMTPPIQGQRLYSREDLAKAGGALDSVMNLSAGQVRMLTAPSYAHATTYFGVARVVGYHGHLWSHAVPGWDAASKKVEMIYKGDKEWRRLLREIGATHIYFGPEELNQYGTPDPPWRRELKNLSRVAQHEIYAVAP